MVVTSTPISNNHQTLSRLLVVVRHGERLDEADPTAWRNIRTAATAGDPPLTERGREQARTAGSLLLSVLQQHSSDLPLKATVLSSPTSRTMATAVELCRELGLSQVTPHYALNCCALAKQEGVAPRGSQLMPSPELLRSVSLSCWPPQGDVPQIDTRNRMQDGFVDALTELASSVSESAGVLVLVTHREGIWELQHAVGLKEGCGYCGFLTFRVTPQQSPAMALETACPAYAGDKKRSISFSSSGAPPSGAGGSSSWQFPAVGPAAEIFGLPKPYCRTRGSDCRLVSLSYLGIAAKKKDHEVTVAEAHRKKFSKVSSIMISYRKDTSALTFENF
jgi:broad specificity phosphatase PhoE